MQNSKTFADDNLRRLSENPYPGSGVVLGTDDSGQNLIQIHWIMGRDENSRNRLISRSGAEEVLIKAVDDSKVTNPYNLFYAAMGEVSRNGRYVVSNGTQTNSVRDSFFAQEFDLLNALRSHRYENDEPDNTPRITGVSYTRGAFIAELSIIRKSSFDDSCRRFLYRYETIPQGFGYFVSTYLGHSEPLLSWEGDPELVPIEGDIADIANSYWTMLDEKNRVSLVVKRIPVSTRPVPQDYQSEIFVINKYE
ncbi:MAG: IMP cyclohydrolase [bacterium]